MFVPEPRHAEQAVPTVDIETLRREPRIRLWRLVETAYEGDFRTRFTMTSQRGTDISIVLCHLEDLEKAARAVCAVYEPDPDAKDDPIDALREVLSNEF